jgi:hypothetical protein
MLRSLPQLFVLVGLVSLSAATHGLKDSTNEPKASVHITPVVEKIRPGQYVKLRCEITNIGSTPFYIPPVVNEVSPQGGFRAFVIYPHDAHVTYSRGGVSSRPGPPRDVVEEITRHWLLLLPGEFYGGTLTTGIQLLEPGKYLLKVTRNPPQFTELEREL